MLFGRYPQRFFPSAEIRCMHFHGIEIQRPAPFYRIFKENLFSQVDQAVDFVLSKIDFSVGTRAESVQVPTAYEVPPDVIREAIVNAVVHRDYLQPSAVQVSVFNERQSAIIPHLKISRRITNAEYRELTRVIARTASRDLEDLVAKGVLQKSAKTGRGTTYTLVQKPDINRTNKTSPLPPAEQDINKTNRTTTSSAIDTETAQSAQTPSNPTRRKAAQPARKRATHAPNAPKATRLRGKKGGAV